MPSPTDGVPGPSTYASNVAPVAAPAPAAAPSTKPGPNPRSRMTLLNKKHSQPLPIALPSLPRGPTTASTPSYGTSILSSFVPSFLAQTASRGIELPTCVGTFDPPTRSVWVTDQRSKEILFNSGFFGKGSLSRSEPSWRQRRVDLLKGGESLMAEQIREKRRIERKQFKIDRAAAMLDAAKTAEAVLVSGLTTASGVTSQAGGESPVPAPGLSRQLSGLEGEGEGEGEGDGNGNGEDQGEGEVEGEGETGTSTPVLEETASIPPSPAPSASSNAVLDYTNLTPQTFLVRPTRPDANRNRGRKAFKRRPPPQKPQTQSQSQSGSQPTQQPSATNPDTAGPAVPSVDTAGPGAASSSLPSAGPSAGRSKDTGTGVDVTIPPMMSQEPQNDEEDADDLARGEEIEEMVQEMEHLQLGTEEAWFLAAGLGVLKVYDPVTDSYPPLPALLPLFLTPLEPPSPGTLTLAPKPPPMYPDDPFLVSYIAYHHYRSLGWVVKPGIKFCCDWLLYRRGPAFSHSAFSLLLIPVPSSSTGCSPHALSDHYADRLSWKWINTVMRVNSLVQKTVILVYVTIPSINDFSSSARTTEGALDFGRIGVRGLLERYAINEVSLTRFGPARRRD